MCYVLGMFNPFKRFMNWLTMRGDLEITEVNQMRILDDPNTSPKVKEAIREARRSTPLSEGELDQLTAETAATIKSAEGKPN